MVSVWDVELPCQEFDFSLREASLEFIREFTQSFGKDTGRRRTLRREHHGQSQGAVDQDYALKLALIGDPPSRLRPVRFFQVRELIRI